MLQEYSSKEYKVFKIYNYPTRQAMVASHETFETKKAYGKRTKDYLIPTLFHDLHHT